MIPSPSLLFNALIDGILLGALYGLAGIGLSLVFGVLHIVNFAHGELIMIGAYITYWLIILTGLNPFIVFTLSLIIIFIILTFLEKVTIEPVMESSEYVLATLLITYALSQALKNFAVIAWTGDWRLIPLKPLATTIINIFGFTTSLLRLVVFIVSISTALFMYYFLTKTMLGRAIQAVADNSEVAKLMGISVKKIYMITFALGGVLAGLAGSLFGAIYAFNPEMGVIYCTKAFIVVVLGGMGSMVGTFIGGLFLGVVESLSGVFWIGGLKEFVSYIMFIVVLMLRPRGLFKGRV